MMFQKHIISLSNNLNNPRSNDLILTACVETTQNFTFNVDFFFSFQP